MTRLYARGFYLKFFRNASSIWLQTMRHFLLQVPLRQRFGALPFAVLCLVLTLTAAASGTWTPLANKPNAGLRNALLLGDGTVMCGDGGTGWYRLTPDLHGSYINGTWSSMASSHYSRYYYSSDVLTNGNVYIAGGEYGSGGDHAELYDSHQNVWSDIPPPTSYPNYSDAISKILPNGNVLQGTTGSGVWIYEASQDAIVAGPSAARGQDETCWVKLPGDNILTLDGGTKSEHYVPSLNAWYQDGNIPVPLFGWGDELGPGFLLPNGNVFYIGGTVNTAIYTPGASATSPGTWVAGPQMVFNGTGLGAIDAPAAMMVNGNILCAIGPTNGFNAPTSFYEYNYLSNIFSQVNGPTGATLDQPTYYSTMLDLPDGSVLLLPTGTQLYVYTPNGAPLAAGQPVISSFTENADGSYALAGTGLNGISAGAAYGDDWQMDSNYPLVRMTNRVTGVVYYARSYNWNSTSVMTSNRVVTTQVALPANLPPDLYSLVVVANGNASAPVTFNYASPPAPTGLSAVIGNTELQLAWNPVPGATAYNVQRSTNGTYYVTIAILSGTSLVDTNLINGVNYDYVVSAVASNGPSSNSSVMTVSPIGLPPVPAGLMAGPDSYLGVNLAWSAVPAAIYYNVKRSTTNGGPYEPLATSPSPFYDDTNVISGAAYYYVVSAVNTSGEGASSAPAGATPVSNGNVTNGLIGWWKFDEGGGTNTADSSGNMNSGILENGPSWVLPGRIGSAALSFVCTNHQFVSVSNAAILNVRSAITIAAWVNADDWSGNHRFLEKGDSDNQYMFMADANELRFHLNSVNTLVAPIPPANTWVHVAATWDGATMIIYVNGQPEASCPATGSIPTTSNPLVIGAKNGSTTDDDYMNGMLDEVRLYNRALTAAEINTIMHVGDTFPVTPAGLVAAPGDAQVTLAWTADTNAASYNVRRSTNSGGPFSLIGTSLSAVYADAGLVNGTVYYYVVSAVNFTNESALSAPVNAKPGIGVTFFANPDYSGAGSQLLGAGSYTLASLEPYGIANDSISSCRIPEGWSVTAYTANNYGGIGITLTSDTPDFSEYSGLNNAMSSCKILNAVPPSKPSSLSAVAGDAVVNLSWPTNGVAPEYIVLRSTADGGPYATIAITTATNFTDYAVTNGGTYYYVVSAMNNAGNSSTSPQAAATPIFSSILLTVNPALTGQFALQFTGVPGRNYVVQTSTNLVNWIPVFTNQTIGGIFTYTDTNATSQARFYRVMQ